MRPIGDWSMSMTLSSCSRPVTLLVRAGEDAGAVQRARGGGVERVDGEATTCREPLTPVTQVKVPSGKAAVTFCEVVGGGAVDGDATCRCPCGGSARSGISRRPVR